MVLFRYSKLKIVAIKLKKKSTEQEKKINDLLQTKVNSLHLAQRFCPALSPSALPQHSRQVLSPIGHSPNGHSPNGHSPNSPSPNGCTPNSCSPNGRSPNCRFCLALMRITHLALSPALSPSALAQRSLT
jgi:hypothetical protein